ncbi:hypothetical protein N7474_006239 [Penicillium riverlandense]|uniref:uncharacterized protein n=1 Tax=Penicillium riverlandense TaxID=1903569 RepID=UPI0025472761|nr:uncharacterized protein N7474_006239 [Penicillium riverlandense]KAJ5820648.1 hypothetical protein N7474_006239 [Penicillium riverlandense]
MEDKNGRISGRSLTSGKGEKADDRITGVPTAPHFSSPELLNVNITHVRWIAREAKRNTLTTTLCYSRLNPRKWQPDPKLLSPLTTDVEYHTDWAHIKKPFSDINLTMHELCSKSAKVFSGQVGFIEFTSELRLPRHIHMDMEMRKLTDERIIVLNGVGLAEIAGRVYVVAPGSLVDAIGGVPHTWTACPAGVRLPDGSISTGSFTMVYEYEDPTRFFPTASTEVVKDASGYIPFEGSYDDIRIPKLTADEVVDRSFIVFNKELTRLHLA